mmetsp:Transcript_15870/g.25736  ORF Transcript_15870/g.25736 Transcript_15870/m.25736 type:complete len:193 (+) Transcript_15870:1-579(+)
MKHKHKVIPWVVLLFLAPVFCLDTGDHSIVSMKLVLNEKRMDDLGWTDAHHVAFRTPILYDDGHKYAVPTGNDAVNFLKAASDDYLCIQNDFGQTALHLAVRQENIDIVNLYIERRIPCMNTGNKDGDTPLHYAAYWGRFECARLLFEEGGADPKARNDKGQTPLDDAREVGKRDIIALLSNDQKEDSKNEL